MTRLLIQCQGSPGPISFKVSMAAAQVILNRYHQDSERGIAIIEDDIVGHYHIDLSLVSWICVIAKSESKP